MKSIVHILLVAIVVCFTGCSNNDLYNDMPEPVAKFVSQYFPNSQIDSFNLTSSGCAVVIKNGPSLDFGRDYAWTTVDGNGSVLPQVFVFDQLPPDLYEYLQETDNTDNVFSVTRTSKVYDVTLLDNSLTYDIATGEITGG